MAYKNSKVMQEINILTFMVNFILLVVLILDIVELKELRYKRAIEILNRYSELNKEIITALKELKKKNHEIQTN